MRYPLKTVPVFKDYIWGGRALRERYNKVSNLPVIAESWEISTHPDGLCTIANGDYAGQTLKEVLRRHPEWIGHNSQRAAFAVLIKLIDAKQPLSLQVHPGDSYARHVHGTHEYGKNEMWYVLEAGPGAELILGFDRHYDRAQLKELIESGSIMDAVCRVPVKAGDCYAIPAGLIHAIGCGTAENNDSNYHADNSAATGAGIVIAEVQQNSNLTYRVYDYGRTDSTGKPRPLHIGNALDVIDTDIKAEKAGSDVLTEWEYFRSELITIKNGMVSRICGAGREQSPVSTNAENTGFECLLVTDGAVTVRSGAGELNLQKGESAFLPAGLGRYELHCARTGATVLSTTA